MKSAKEWERDWYAATDAGREDAEEYARAIQRDALEAAAKHAEPIVGHVGEEAELCQLIAKEIRDLMPEDA